MEKILHGASKFLFMLLGVCRSVLVSRNMDIESVHPCMYVFPFFCMLCIQSVAECIQFYYLTKKNENYKQLLRKQNMKRSKKALQKSQVWLYS